MIDSCSPRKLDPGLAHTYSKPSALIVSTMKSEPARPPVNGSSATGSAADAAAVVSGDCAAVGAAGVAIAALTAAARRMNSRLGSDKRDRRFIG
jgi:hypothetical protein